MVLFYHLTLESSDSDFFFLSVVGLFSQYEVIPKSNVAATFCDGESAFMRISSYIDWIKSHDIGEICD